MLVLTTGRWAWVPSLVLLGIVACLLNIEHMTARLNLAFFSTLIGIWLVWYVYMFGWSSGSPHILIPILSMAFFNIYEPPAGKIAYCLGLIIFRVGLFAYSLNHTPVSSINPTVNLAFQIVNSVMGPMGPAGGRRG